MSSTLTNQIVTSIAELERFRGSWQTFGGLASPRIEVLEEKAQTAVVTSLCGKSEHKELLSVLADGQATLFLSQRTLFGWYRKLTGEKAALGEEASEQLRGLLEWTVAGLEAMEVHPLIVAAHFANRFQSLAPFEKQNECVRTLALRLLLLKSGFQYVRCLAFEPLLATEVSQEDEAQQVESFLETLLKAKRALEEELLLQGQLLDLNEEEEHILTLAFDRPRLSISELEEETHLGRNKLKQRLRTLVKGGHLEQHGRGKGTWYSNAFSVRS